MGCNRFIIDNRILVFGEGGVGKDSFINAMLDKYSPASLKRIVRYTTRNKRDGETDGIDYNFINEKEYQSLLKQNKLIFTHGYNRIQNGICDKVYYGTKKSDFKQRTISTVSNLELIDVFKDDKLAKSLIKNTLFIRLYVDKGSRVDMMRKRGDEEKEILRRIEADEKEWTSEEWKGTLKKIPRHQLIMFYNEFYHAPISQIVEDVCGVFNNRYN